MNRLTEKINNWRWRLKGVNRKQITPGAEITDEVWRKLYGALCRLKDYEDTGLMPDEIERMKGEERQRWIPVTERLPEVSCNSMLGWDKNYRRSCLVQYNGYGFILPTGQYMDIIAWMPLPEPYTEGKE